MKFSLKLFKKAKTISYMRRHFSVPTMGLVRAEIQYLPEEVENDNDVLYLIMKQIHKTYSIKLLPDQIQLLN